MLELGTHIEKYEVLEDLGAGGMARVFKVRHTLLGSFHVLKVLDPSLVADEQMRKRFLGEGQIQAQVRHPNIAQVTDVIIQPGVAGLVVELVPGQALDDWLAAQTQPPAAGEIKRLFLPLLAGVGYAHSRGIIHRDIKPANVVVDGALTPKILDFGIAKVVDAAFGGNAVEARTKTGSRLGTPNYMSPEQIRGLPDLDSRSDIFSLAATLYEVVTLQVPFDAPSDFDIMRRIVDGDLRPPRELVAGLDPVLDACIAKGLATNRAERFASCREFASLLERAGRSSARPSISTATRSSVPAAHGPRGGGAATVEKAPVAAPGQRSAGSWAVLALLTVGLSFMLGLVLESLLPRDPAGADPAAATRRKRAAEAEARRRSVGRTVKVPAGEFWMGCAPQDPECESDEKPGRSVYLDAFRVDRTEVTVAQYRACVDDKVCSSSGLTEYPTCTWGRSGRDDHPINCVDWNQARTYCRWAGMRLPTEAQWEKAARGTDQRLSPWGNAKASCHYAVMEHRGKGCGAGGTMPVGSRPAGASPYGALDMSGNVWEWVADWYAPNTYRSARYRNPSGPSNGSVRVFRGGSWLGDGPRLLRSSYRLRDRMKHRYDYLGFRCVRSSP